MADKMGPVSGGEILHDCDCMKYSCFCGKVKHLSNDDIHVCGEGSLENDSDSDWTTCSEGEFEELQQEPQGYVCDARQCNGKPGCSTSTTTHDLSAVSL